jgi:hypothetical protein
MANISVALVDNRPIVIDVGENTDAAAASASAAAGSASDAAISASFAEEFSGPAYDTVGAGEAATTTGRFFRVSAGGTPRTYTRYQRTSGGSAEAAPLATSAALAASGGTGLLGHIATGAGATVRTVQAKLRDTVSVKDFGAVGDDVANDTAAFVAAAATGLPVFIPHGTYRVAGVAFNARVFFQGGKIRRTGGTLAFSGGIDAAPGDNIFLDAVGIAQVDVNNTLTPEGWVDWFGYDANAIETCHAIFRVNRFGPRDYFADRTVILDKSNRFVIGARGSAEGSGGTRIVLTGGATASQPVVRVGTLNTSVVASTARRLNITGINTIRDGVVNPAASGRREDAVPGWLIAGWYESEITNCFDYGSPIHYRVYGTITCTMRDCYGVRPNAGASNGFPDFYTAFCIGGYSTSFGFIGANASLTIDNCGTAGGVGTDRMGLFLFGYVGDTWTRLFECSQIEYGILVDGRDAGGTTISALTAHQDVRIRECVLDALLFRGLWIRGINGGGHVTCTGNYISLNAAGDGALLQDCLGAVSFTDEDYIASPSLNNIGIRGVVSKRFTIAPSCKLKNFRTGMDFDNCQRFGAEATISRTSTGGTDGVKLALVSDATIAPIIDGEVVAYDYGVNASTLTTKCKVDPTGINIAALSTGAAARKIWYNGATWGGGGTFGTGNVATGVLT